MRGAWESTFSFSRSELGPGVLMYRKLPVMLVLLSQDHRWSDKSLGNSREPLLEQGVKKGDLGMMDRKLPMTAPLGYNQPFKMYRPTMI